MAEINDLEIVDADNTARFPENQAPSTVNDGARALEGIVARWNNDTSGSITAGGTANDITIAATQTLTALVDGQNFQFTAADTNTGAMTCNVDAIGAVDIKLQDGSAVPAGAVVNGGIYKITYDGTNFQITSTTSTSGDVFGPASATADSLAKYDGVTGKLLKDGAVIGTDVQAYDADNAVTDAIQVFTKPQRPTVTALTSTSNSIAIELNDSNDFSHTFTENTTLANPTSVAVAGQKGTIYFTQAAGANYTLAFGSEYDFVGGTAFTVTATNAAKDSIDYAVRADGIIELSGFANWS